MSWSKIKHVPRLLCIHHKFEYLLKQNCIKNVPIINTCVRYLSSNNLETQSVVANIEKKFQDNTFNINNEVHNEEKASALKHMKYSLLLLGLSFTIIGSYIVFTFGAPEIDEDGQLILDEFSSKPLWQQYILRTTKQIEKFTLLIQEPSRDKLLPDPLTYPYYQPPYTLVLEFTDVLAHPEWTYQTGWRFKKRPGVDYLLENLVGLYEIVIFTAEPGITIFPVIEALDQKNLISYKLVRDSTHFIDGHHVKNLDKLNRDLSKVIVIDWNSNSVKFHPNNHFAVDRWKGSDEDDILIELTAFLKTIAQTSIDDVREVLIFYKQFENPLITFKQKQLEFFEKQQQNLDKSIVNPKDSVRKLWNMLL